MTDTDYRSFVVDSVAEHLQGDSTALDLIAKALAESEQAKDVLRKRGYGVTGMGIVETTLEVPERDGHG